MVRKVPPYTALAPVYDLMMSHVNYRRWANYIARIITRAGFTEVRLLDVGCGTGKFVQEMRKLGYQIDGCDASPEMLRVFQERIPDARGFCCRLPELPEVPAQRYNVMTCLYDTLNYLTDQPTLLQALQCIYRKLDVPGLFIFDMVSSFHCQQYFRDYVEREVLDERFAFERRSHFDVHQQLQWNRIKIFTPDGIFEEEHQQRIYDFKEIIELIQRETGFIIKDVYRDFTFRPVRVDSGRAHFVLLKRPGHP
ncbi:MAG: class I SAM-dependent methyltransferase [Calditrichaeota bacterium]|nr:class I SAM-dependent methyltransferase [Calditrichota bacterium]